MVAERGVVLVVEDSPELAELMSAIVEREGFTGVAAGSAAEARAAYQRHRPVAVLLDWVLPDAPGTELCRELRGQDPELTVIFVSGRNDETSMARGLDAGADDYVVKPFALDELLARIRAFERRSPATGQSRGKLRFEDLELDRDAMTAHRGVREIALSRTEYQLLELLLANPRRVMSRDVIFEKVWGYDFGPDSNSLDVYIGYLRRKLEQDREPRLIHTVRGVGYVMKDAG